MQKNSAIILAIVTLVVGLGLGYAMGGNKAPAPQVASNASGMHMMPDGTMMSNGGSQPQTMSMSDMMASMNAGLQGKTGDAFDQEFLSEMIVHHQGAVQMAQLALTNAKHQEIKDLAKNIISAQTSEISEMQGWQKNWYGNN
ncbi:MAG: DUF305 domain-containing protein [Bacteroidetes bacterium]|nr:DUF305 domain-containing protein [Bacteroidota bacterium]